LAKADEQEQKRLVDLERQLIDEMKQNLFAILNEKAKISDVRESDVKEIEFID